MPNLHISVSSKKATYHSRYGEIVCGNSDYKIIFEFDSEWDAHEKKVARFIWNTQFFDQEFTGNECPVPKIKGTLLLQVGVYAGDLATTTVAEIPCRLSVLCEDVVPSEENDKHYANEAKEAADRAEAAAKRTENIENMAEEAVSIAKGANQAISVADYSSLIERIKEADADEFKVGQNIYIEQKDIPDVWIAYVEPDQFTDYNYVSDEQFIADVNAYPYGISIGHYSVCFLETQKVDLAEYFKRTEVQTLVNSSLANAKASGEFDGKDGADGKTPYIQNGYWYIDGVNTNVKARGDKGDPAPSEAVLYTPQNLTTAQQEQARANLGIVGEEQYEFADSVEDIPTDADTSKKYVIDGYIYTYQTKTVEVIHNANDGTGYINNNPTGTWGNTPYTRTGCWCSPLIHIDPTKMAPVGNPTQSRVTIGGIEKVVPFYNGYSVVVYYYAQDGTQKFMKTGSDLVSINTKGEKACPFTFNLKDVNVFADSNWAQIYGVRIALGVSSSSITADDVKNLYVNIPFFDITETNTGWMSTGQEFNGDKQTQQNTADIETLKGEVQSLGNRISDIEENGGLADISTGEVLYAIGDSITYGTNVGGNSGSWVKHLIDKNGYDAVNSKNFGVSGIGFCTTASGKTVRTVVDENNFAAADIVTVAIGINDWKNPSATVENFFSEMEYCLNKIRTDNPYCRIFYILPFNAKYGNFNTFYALGFKGEGNAALCYGNILQAFINMMKAKFEEDTFKSFHINVIDMTKTPAITRYNIDTALGDGLHPTAECHKELAKEIARRIALT